MLLPLCLGLFMLLLDGAIVNSHVERPESFAVKALAGPPEEDPAG